MTIGFKPSIPHFSLPLPQYPASGRFVGVPLPSQGQPFQLTSSEARSFRMDHHAFDFFQASQGGPQTQVDPAPNPFLASVSPHEISIGDAWALSAALLAISLFRRRPISLEEIRLQNQITEKKALRKECKGLGIATDELDREIEGLKVNIAKLKSGDRAEREETKPADVEDLERRLAAAQQEGRELAGRVMAAERAAAQLKRPDRGEAQRIEALERDLQRADVELREVTEGAERREKGLKTDLARAVDDAIKADAAKGKEIGRLQGEIDRLEELIGQEREKLKRLEHELAAAIARVPILEGEKSKAERRAAAETERAEQLSRALLETQGDVARLKEEAKGDIERLKGESAILRTMADTFAGEPEPAPAPFALSPVAPLQPRRKITLTGLENAIAKFFITIPPAQTHGGPQWCVLPGPGVKGPQARNPVEPHYATVAIDDEGIYIRKVKVDDARRVVIVREKRTVFEEIEGIKTYYTIQPGDEIAFIDRGGRIVVARYGPIKKIIDEFLSEFSSGAKGDPKDKPPSPPLPPPPPRRASRINPKADPFEHIHDLEIPEAVLDDAFVRKGFPTLLELFRQQGEYRTLRELLASLELKAKQALWERVKRYHAPYLSVCIPNQLLPEIAAEAIMLRILLNIPPLTKTVYEVIQVNLIRQISIDIRERDPKNPTAPIIPDDDFEGLRKDIEKDRERLTQSIEDSKKDLDRTRPDYKDRRPKGRQPPPLQRGATPSRSRVTGATQPPIPSVLPDAEVLSDPPPPDADPEDVIRTAPVPRLSDHEAGIVLEEAITSPTGATEADRRLAQLRQSDLEIPHAVIERVLNLDPYRLRGLYRTHLKTSGGVPIRDVNMLTHHLERRMTDRIVSGIFLADPIPLEKAGPEFVARAVATVLDEKLPPKERLDESRLDHLIQELIEAIRRSLKKTGRLVREK